MAPGTLWEPAWGMRLGQGCLRLQLSFIFLFSHQSCLIPPCVLNGMQVGDLVRI